MKPLLRVSSFILLVAVAIHISCKKETSCEGCAEKNKPPIAVAGPDQAITLPIDSVSLDGRSSSDPDGSISNYLWTKISGLVSSNILKPTDSLTKVRSLVAGSYLFELKVTDNGGLSARDTMQVLVYSTTNHPPIANAGNDTTIALPNNSINLDGSRSTDPENNITSYAWTKISGPTSFNIINSNAAQTQLTNLVQGTYQFELKVTDARNLFSKDTMHVLVNLSGSSTSISVTGCNAAMTSFGHLSQEGMGGIVSAGSKIFFSGYLANGANNGVTDIYDTVTQTWSTSNLGFGNINLGNKLFSSTYNYPINQQLFNIYDASTGSFTTHIAPEARAFIRHTVSGNKIVFAGGFNPDSAYGTSSKRLDIYDALSNSWSSVNFNEARGDMAVESFGSKIFFAGGYQVRYDSLVQVCDDNGNNCDLVPAIVPVTRIDIYDLSTNSWSVANLSEPRAGITTSVVGNMILFAGGGGSTRVDIYDASTNNWSTAQLSSYIYDQLGRKRAHVVGNKVLFTRLWSATVDIYNAENNSWSTAQMSQPNGQSDYEVATKGNKIVFFTVFDLEGVSKNIDIYDAATNTWCHAVLSRNLTRSGIISTGNKVYIAGGFTKSNPNGVYDQVIDDIWVFDF